MAELSKVLNSIVLTSPAMVEQLHDAVVKVLGDAYDCNRVWSAWGVGTMSEDDFVLVAEDAERVTDIIAAVSKVLMENLPKIGPRIYVPQHLHTDSADLVLRFSCALAEKMYKAEVKHGLSNNWVNNDWLDECRLKLQIAIGKGDPIDVAIYSMFLWHHSAQTYEASYEIDHIAAVHSEGFPHFSNELDSLDASIFSSDALHNKTNRQALQHFLFRWSKELAKMDHDCSEDSEGDHD